MTAYSITPEGATEAAKEICGSRRVAANSAVMLKTVYFSEAEMAAIILRHAEQSPEETCVHCGATRDVHGLISAAAASCAFESTQSSEGEMREACIVCGCALMPPERTEPPHCMDCALTDEHYYAWEAGKEV